MLSKFLLISIIFVHIFVLTKLIYFPYPELFVYPYLTNHGLKPYKDILDQHFPGLLFLPINFDNLGLNNEFVARNWSLGIIILTHLLLFFVSSKLLKSKSRALIANILYLVWQPFFEGWVLWIDSFLPLMLLPSFYFYYNKRLIISGLLLGIGIVFKQTLIPLSFLLVCYTLWQTKSVKKTYVFLLSILAPLMVMVLYLVSIGVLRDFWYWTIVFNLTVYASFGTSLPASLAFVIRVLVVYLPSLLAWFHENKRLVIILYLFLIGSLAGVFDRADFVHFQPSLPFAILATVLAFERFGKNKIFRVLVLIYFIIAGWWLNIFFKGHISEKVFFFDDQTKLTSKKIKEYTSTTDKIFIYGVPNNLYQMSQRLPSGNIFVYQFPWFMKVAEDRILEGLINDPPKIIVYDSTYQVEGTELKDFSKKIYNYIETYYQKIDNVGETSILLRK